jgi:hypothetical protein
MMEGAKSLNHWLLSSAGTRAYTLSRSSSLASRPLTLFAASIDSKLRKLTGNHNPQIKRLIRRSMMMNLKTIRIITVMVVHKKIKMMARMLRTKSLKRIMKSRSHRQRKLKKKVRPMTS